MEKCSRKRSITRLPPGGSSAAHCHFPRPRVQNPSERSVPWKPHPHATPFYTVECTCKLVTNYIFHNPLFGQSQRGGYCEQVCHYRDIQLAESTQSPCGSEWGTGVIRFAVYLELHLCRVAMANGRVNVYT